MCCAYGAVNAAHVQAALMCRTCASFCHTSFMRNMYATCVRNMCCLHTCMLQVCCTSVCCMYAYYYSAAHMPLAHMQATSVPHIRYSAAYTQHHIIYLSINPMYLNVAVLLIKGMPELHHFMQEDLFQELIISFHVCCIHKN